MGRLLTFPEPLPDEDFRSVVFRYHCRSGNSEFNESKNDLFGVRSHKHTFLPQRLQILLNNLPIGHDFTVDQILNDHTWYGLYQAFFTIERHSAVMHVIKNGARSQRNFKGQPTLSSQSMFATELKYCPICVHSDEQQYGEVFLHRTHQVAFLDFCPTHHTRLVSKCRDCDMPYGSSQSGHLLREPYCKNGHALLAKDIDITDKKNQLQIELIEDLLYVREHSKNLTAQEIRIKFYEEMFAQGYITLTGVVQKKKLLFEFERWCVGEYKTFLNELSMESQYFKDSLLNSQSMAQSIGFYFLLARFLNGSLKGLLLSQKPFAMPIPFGNGPWSCHNPNCKNKGSPNIFQCTRKIINGRSGVFLISYHCPCCGLLSINTGSEFCYKSSITKSNIIKIDPNIISEAAIAFEQVAASTEDTSFKWDRRMKMTELLANNAFRNRTEIRRKAETLYRWLMENDKEWFEVVLPAKTVRNTLKLDFKAVDKELTLKIRTIAAMLDPEYKLPVKRKTIINLLEPADRNRLLHYKSRLPLSMGEIDKYVESTKQFLIRSIPRHYSKLLKKGASTMTLAYFKHNASVSYHLHKDDEVDCQIRDFLRKKGALIET